MQKPRERGEICELIKFIEEEMTRKQQMSNYVIEKMDLNNVEHYARVNALAWFQSYKYPWFTEYGTDLIHPADLEAFIQEADNMLISVL